MSLLISFSQKSQIFPVLATRNLVCSHLFIYSFLHAAS